MPEIITPPYYPIVYVRGYAATMGEIEETVATPYMGFNLGSTKIRRDYMGRPNKFIFESPLIRLMKDHGYIDTYVNGELVEPPMKLVGHDGKARTSELVPARSIWIFRYYEQVSEELGTGERQSIPYFAADLRKFILDVRDAVCGDDAVARDAFKVNLVAHSMGGLICRCYLQNICRSSSPPSDWDRNEDLKLNEGNLVHKVFTYGTPHNGIDVKGINVPDLGDLDKLETGTFNRGKMRKYLKIDDETDDDTDNETDDANSLDGAFDPNNFFCFVGTNYRDYGAFFGLSKKATGPMSDGLVMCDNAYVKDAPRAFAHRAHSGPYGIVNSEEGFQNLRRFLFGDVRADVLLRIDDITLPRRVQKLRAEGHQIRASYQIESTAKVRGGNVVLHERLAAHESAMFRRFEELVDNARRMPIFLFSGFLDSGLKAAGSDDKYMAFAVSLAVKVPVYEVDKKFWFDEHFEGDDIFSEVFFFYVRFTDSGPQLRYSIRGTGEKEQKLKPLQPVEDPEFDVPVFKLPIGFKATAANKPPGRLSGEIILKGTRALA